MRIAFDFAPDDRDRRKSSRSSDFDFVPEAKFVAQLFACHVARQHHANGRMPVAGIEAYLSPPRSALERPQWISKIV